jgi:hypothetical protein
LILTILLMALAVSMPALADEARPVATRPLLTADLPRDVALEYADKDERGYYELLDTADGMARIVMLRRAGSVALNDLLAEAYPEAKDIRKAEQAPVASYPAARATFEMGANEDSRKGVIVAFSTDTDSFGFIVQSPLDFFEEQSPQFEVWIDSLDVFDGADPASGGFDGLLLACGVPEDAQTDGAVVAENGDYTQRYNLDAGLVSFAVARRKANLNARALLAELYPEARDVESAAQKPVAGCQAQRVTFSLGKNEDSRQGVMVWFSAGGVTFAYAADIRLDDFEDYQGTLESWITALDLVDG